MYLEESIIVSEEVNITRDEKGNKESKTNTINENDV